MPRVKRTRLRRSGIRKMFRNFSSMVGYPLQATSPIRMGVLLSYAISRFPIDYLAQRNRGYEDRHTCRPKNPEPQTRVPQGLDVETREDRILSRFSERAAQDYGLP